MEEFTWQDEILVTVAADVERFGCAIVYVGGTCAKPGCPGDHESDLDLLGLPAYGYTVGLQDRVSHPELVILGAGRERTLTVLNATADAIAGGARFAPGDLFELDGVTMKFGSCASGWVRDGIIAVSIDFHLALGYTGGPPPLQIMWPDRDGRLPDDPAHDRRAQPWLARRRVRDRARRVRS